MPVILKFQLFPNVANYRITVKKKKLYCHGNYTFMSNRFKPLLFYMSVIKNSITPSYAKKFECIRQKFAALCNNNFFPGPLWL